MKAKGGLGVAPSRGKECRQAVKAWAAQGEAQCAQSVVPDDHMQVRRPIAEHFDLTLLIPASCPLLPPSTHFSWTQETIRGVVAESRLELREEPHQQIAPKSSLRLAARLAQHL